MVINGGDLVDANKWYTSVSGGNTVPQYYTYSATNVRLQEASIGYTIRARCWVTCAKSPFRSWAATCG